MKILITGATGYVGGQLLPRLLESGHEVTCMVRDASRLSHSLEGAHCRGRCSPARQSASGACRESKWRTT